MTARQNYPDIWFFPEIFIRDNRFALLPDGNNMTRRRKPSPGRDVTICGQPA